MREYTFMIPAMHDETSAKDVRSIITGIRGIEDVDVDFENGIVDVYYDENKVIIDKIRYLIEKQGYTIRNL
ncbi:MAG: heavy-metal-associated domain-containing protein [Caloramator sp.]|nr:heavy-metal-associated domain-containing protein [Caloramator sp.]